MKAKVVLMVVLMMIIPVFTSAQTKSGDDSAPTNPPGAADSLLPDRGPTNGPASWLPGPARSVTGISDSNVGHYADLHSKPCRDH